MLQCAAEGRINDHHLAPPQAQNLPDDGADVVHIHLLYDAPGLDLPFTSIPHSIKFIGRFGDEQRQLRQKCHFLCSIHLLTPINLLSRTSWHVSALLRESVLALQTSLMSQPWLVWRKWRRAAADSAVRLPRRGRNGGLPQSIRIAGKAAHRSR